MTPEQQLIVDTTRKYLGLPWHPDGRSQYVGTDCGGLLFMVGRELGYMPWRWDLDQNDFHRAQRGNFWGPFPGAAQVRSGQAGDIAIIGHLAGHHREEFPWHVGILAEDARGGLTVIHMQVVFPERTDFQTVAEDQIALFAGRRMDYWRWDKALADEARDYPLPGLDPKLGKGS